MLYHLKNREYGAGNGKHKGKYVVLMDAGHLMVPRKLHTQFLLWIIIEMLMFVVPG